MAGSGWDSVDEDPAEDQDAPCFYLHLFVLLQIATKLWRRQHVFYCMYPWRLSQLVDDRLSDEEKNTIAQQFFDAHQCCLDEGCSLRVQSLATRERDLPRIAEIISMQKPINAEIEDNFARHQSAARTSRGHLQFSQLYL